MAVRVVVVWADVDDELKRRAKDWVLVAVLEHDVIANSPSRTVMKYRELYFERRKR